MYKADIERGFVFYYDTINDIIKSVKRGGYDLKTVFVVSDNMVRVTHSINGKVCEISKI